MRIEADFRGHYIKLLPVVETAIPPETRHGLRTPGAIQNTSALSLQGPPTFPIGDKIFRKLPSLQVHVI